jgi:uncharacterized membrane protein YbhN (UPF0104 family)
MRADPAFRRRLLWTAAGAAVVILAVYGASRVVNPGDFRQAFADVEWPWVAVSAALYAVCQVTSAMVWHAGLRAGGLADVGRGYTIGAHWIARGASEFVPPAVGEAVRVATVSRHEAARGPGAWRVAGSVGSYRTVDGGVSLLVVAVLALVMPLPAGTGGVRWIAIGAVLVAGILALGVWRMGSERVARLLPGRLAPTFRQLADGAQMLRSRPHLLGALGMQSLTVLGRIVCLGALLVAFGVSPVAAPLVYCLITLAALIAISPGGFGIREAAVVPVLVVGYGLAVESALAFSIAVQASGMVVSLAGAAVALVALRFRRAGVTAAPPEVARPRPSDAPSGGASI